MKVKWAWCVLVLAGAATALDLPNAHKTPHVNNMIVKKRLAPNSGAVTTEDELPLVVGQQVRLKGLFKAPHLNGRIAEIVGKDQSRARYVVILPDKDDTVFTVRPGNVERHLETKLEAQIVSTPAVSMHEPPKAFDGFDRVAIQGLTGPNAVYNGRVGVVERHSEILPGDTEPRWVVRLEGTNEVVSVRSSHMTRIKAFAPPNPPTMPTHQPAMKVTTPPAPVPSVERPVSGEARDGSTPSAVEEAATTSAGKMEEKPAQPQGAEVATNPIAAPSQTSKSKPDELPTPATSLVRTGEQAPPELKKPVSAADDAELIEGPMATETIDALAVGDRVVLQKVTSDPSYNGRAGVFQGPDEEKAGRYIVHLDSSDDEDVSVRRENMGLTPLKVGDVVLMHGFVTDGLNGESGVVEGFSDARGMYVVRVGARHIYMARGNLQATAKREQHQAEQPRLSVTDGSLVVLHDLAENSFNGLVGSVDMADLQKKRAVVTLARSGDKVVVPLANLRPIRSAADAQTLVQYAGKLIVDSEDPTKSFPVKMETHPRVHVAVTSVISGEPLVPGRWYHKRGTNKDISLPEWSALPAEDRAQWELIATDDDVRRAAEARIRPGQQPNSFLKEWFAAGPDDGPNKKATPAATGEAKTESKKDADSAQVGDDGAQTRSFLSDISGQPLSIGNWYHKQGERYDITGPEYELMSTNEKEWYVPVTSADQVAQLRAKPWAVVDVDSANGLPTNLVSDISGERLKPGQWYHKRGAPKDITRGEWIRLPEAERSDWDAVVSTDDIVKALADSNSAASVSGSESTGPAHAEEKESELGLGDDRPYAVFRDGTFGKVSVDKYGKKLSPSTLCLEEDGVHVHRTFRSDVSGVALTLGDWYHKQGESVDITSFEYSMLSSEEQSKYIPIKSIHQLVKIVRRELKAPSSIDPSMFAPSHLGLTPPKYELITPDKAKPMADREAPSIDPQVAVTHMSDISHQPLVFGHWFHKKGHVLDISDEELKTLTPYEKEGFVAVNTEDDLQTIVRPDEIRAGSPSPGSRIAVPTDSKLPDAAPSAETPLPDAAPPQEGLNAPKLALNTVQQSAPEDVPSADSFDNSGPLEMRTVSWQPKGQKEPVVMRIPQPPPPVMASVVNNELAPAPQRTVLETLAHGPAPQFLPPVADPPTLQAPALFDPKQLMAPSNGNNNNLFPPSWDLAGLLSKLPMLQIPSLPSWSATTPRDVFLTYHSDKSGAVLRPGDWYHRLGANEDLTGEEWLKLPKTEKIKFVRIDGPSDIQRIEAERWVHDQNDMIAAENAGMLPLLGTTLKKAAEAQAMYATNTLQNWVRQQERYYNDIKLGLIKSVPSALVHADHTFAGVRVEDDPAPPPPLAEAAVASNGLKIKVGV